jgi:integrase
MSKRVSLKVRRDHTRPSPWYVNIPPPLSETGKRQRLYFSTRDQAQGHCEKLKAQKDNFGTSLAALTPARIAAAAEAFKLLDPHGIDLLDAVRSHLEAFLERTASVTLAEAFDRFSELKVSKSPKYRNEIRQTKATFESLWTEMVCDITAADLEPILDQFSDGSRNAKMRRLRSVFNLAIKRGWMRVGTNPIARLHFADTVTKEVEIYTPGEVRAMLGAALEHDAQLLPFLVLGFFCGIRPEGELGKLEWRDLKFDGEKPQVVIRPEVSKTKRRRFIDLSQNALAWIEAYRHRSGRKLEGKIVPFGISTLHERRRLNREAAGVKRSIQQGMRHTFCSNWLALHEDVNRLVLQSGHDSVDTMWRAYHKGVPEAEAREFWNIRPAGEGRKIIPLAAG